MGKIKDQTNTVRQLLFSADTAATYQKALTLTWDILRETGILIWLILCLTVVGAEWFWKTAIRLGYRGRSWYEDLKTPASEEPKSASAIGQSILGSLGSSTETLLYQAKQQLGIEAAPPVAKPIAPKSTASHAPTAPNASAPPMTATPASPSPKPTSISAADIKGTDSEE